MCKFKIQVRDTRLRMPNKWHMCKEGQASKKKETTACVFWTSLTFLRPEANRAVFILPWVVSPGRSYGCLWVGLIIRKKKKVMKDNSTPAYSPVSDRRRLTAFVDVHLARRLQAPMPQISGPRICKSSQVTYHQPLILNFAKKKWCQQNRKDHGCGKVESRPLGYWIMPASKVTVVT
jgi:hypothetical protein